MAASGPAAGVDLRVRRSIEELSRLDVTRLKRAFAAALETSGERGYMHVAGIYGLPLPIHAVLHRPGFLPWNRAYLMAFEAMLRGFEPGISLPWWNWSASRRGGYGIPPAFDLPEDDGAPNPLFAVEVGAEQLGGEEPSRATSREPGTLDELPGKARVERLLAIDDFEEFSNQLQILHDMIHLWVGGTNGEVAMSSYDPFFWTYQASIDRIWCLWQEVHPDAEPPGGLEGMVLTPFPESVRDVWDLGSLGYEYARPSGRVTEYLAGAASDRPANVDRLNFADYAYAFAEIVAAPHTKPPLTIGIYGSWGIGKSSLLEMIAREFRAETNGPQKQRDKADRESADVHLVEFNAWQFSSCERIWPSLVRKIMETVEKEAEWSFISRFSDTAKRNAARLWRRHRNRLVATLAILGPLLVLLFWQVDFSPAAIAAAIVALGVPGVVKLGVEASQSPISRWAGALVDQEEYGDELPFMREIHDDLEFLIGRLREVNREEDGDAEPAPGTRVLVMIDDLDRCEPTKAVEVLQAINLLLNFEVFVVCLGIDARLVSAAIEAHYEKLLGEAGASGYEYLDKIVQIPFLIPSANGDEVVEFLASQMPVAAPSADGDGPEDGAGGDRPSFGVASYAEDDQGEEDEPGEEGEQASSAATGRQRLGAFEASEVRGFQGLAPFIRSNPRHIKRLINVYRIVRTLGIRRDIEPIVDKPEVTIAWIVICAQWPYSAGAILREFERLGDDAAAEEKDGLLLHLYSRNRPAADRQREFDDDPEMLEQLLRQTWISAEELDQIRAYTLNFNPAVGKALREISPPSTGFKFGG